jgi:2-methylcitrate dehydratase PrpD
VGRTRAIAGYVSGAVDTPLDGVVVDLASRHLLDSLAAIVACRDLDAATVARRYVAMNAGAARPGPAAATILGTTTVAPLLDAVFASAMTGHAAEINDFIPSVFVQPGPAIVSTAVGAGEARGASGTAVLRAMVAGYEVAARIPRALGLENMRRAGIATHGVAPCFGSATAAAAMLGLGADRIAYLFSLVGQQAAGSSQWLLDVEHVEKAFVFAGLGARNGLQAALLVEAGFRGVPDALERDGTWFTGPAFVGGDGDLDALTRGLGETYALGAVAYKRYPVGGPAQPAVQALLHLCPQVEPGDVERVLIEMPGLWEAFRDAAMPALNLPYLASIILLDGRLDFISAQSLDRMRQDAAVVPLRERVEIRHDPTLEAPPGEPRAEAARVTITLRDGTTLAHEVPHVLGYPSHPMSRADVEAKAVELVAPQLGDDRAQRLVEACRDVASITAADLAALVARPD